MAQPSRAWPGLGLGLGAGPEPPIHATQRTVDSSWMLGYAPLRSAAWSAVEQVDERKSSGTRGRGRGRGVGLARGASQTRGLGRSLGRGRGRGMFSGQDPVGGGGLDTGLVTWSRAASSKVPETSMGLGLGSDMSRGLGLGQGPETRCAPSVGTVHRNLDPAASVTGEQGLGLGLGPGHLGTAPISQGGAEPQALVLYSGAAGIRGTRAHSTTPSTSKRSSVAWPESAALSTALVPYVDNDVDLEALREETRRLHEENGQRAQRQKDRERELREQQREAKALARERREAAQVQKRLDAERKRQEKLVEREEKRLAKEQEREEKLAAKEAEKQRNRSVTKGSGPASKRGKGLRGQPLQIEAPQQPSPRPPRVPVPVAAAEHSEAAEEESEETDTGDPVDLAEAATRRPVPGQSRTVPKSPKTPSASVPVRKKDLASPSTRKRGRSSSADTLAPELAHSEEPPAQDETLALAVQAALAATQSMVAAVAAVRSASEIGRTDAKPSTSLGDPSTDPVRRTGHAGDTVLAPRGVERSGPNAPGDLGKHTVLTQALQALQGILEDKTPRIESQAAVAQTTLQGRPPPRSRLITDDWPKVGSPPVGPGQSETVAPGSLGAKVGKAARPGWPDQVPVVPVASPGLPDQVSVTSPGLPTQVPAMSCLPVTPVSGVPSSDGAHSTIPTRAHTGAPSKTAAAPFAVQVSEPCIQPPLSVASSLSSASVAPDPTPLDDWFEALEAEPSALEFGIQSQDGLCMLSAEFPELPDPVPKSVPDPWRCPVSRPPVVKCRTHETGGPSNLAYVHCPTMLHALFMALFTVLGQPSYGLRVATAPTVYEVLRLSGTEVFIDFLCAEAADRCAGDRKRRSPTPLAAPTLATSGSKDKGAGCAESKPPQQTRPGHARAATKQALVPKTQGPESVQVLGPIRPVLAHPTATDHGSTASVGRSASPDAPKESDTDITESKGSGPERAGDAEPRQLDLQGVPFGHKLFGPMGPVGLSAEQVRQTCKAHLAASLRRYWVPQRNTIVGVLVDFKYRYHGDLGTFLCSTHPARLVAIPGPLVAAAETVGNAAQWLVRRLGPLTMDVRERLRTESLGGGPASMTAQPSPAHSAPPSTPNPLGAARHAVSVSSTASLCKASRETQASVHRPV